MYDAIDASNFGIFTYRFFDASIENKSSSKIDRKKYEKIGHPITHSKKILIGDLGNFKIKRKNNKSN